MGIFDGVLLCSDIDGTLTDNTSVPERNAAYLRYFMDNGGMFTLSTGRLPRYLKEMKSSVTPNVPMVCVNGTAIYDLSTQEVLYEAKLSHPLKEEIIRYVAAKQPEAKCFVYNVEHILDIRQADDAFSPNKMVFHTPDEETAISLAKELREKFGDRIQAGRSWNVGLEVIPIDAGKGVCVKKLKELLGAKFLICVGDYENDITMLQVADIGYAVENALESVKAAADRVTVSNTRGAIAEIIKLTEQELRS